MITCLVLGSGGAVPTADRTPAAYWIDVDGRSVLVDPGPGALVRLVGAEGGPADLDGLDTLLFTHLHLDHCADLPALLFALHGPVTASERPLQLIGPRGLAAYLERLRDLWGDWLEPKRRTLEILELDPGSVLRPPAGDDGPWRAGEDVGGASIHAFAAAHGESRFSERCLGYRFRDAQAHTLVYSGDSGPCSSLTDAARACDLLLCECSLPDEWAEPGHMTPSDVGRLCREARPGAAVLTHLYPACDALDLEDLVGELWEGPVVRAADGMLLKVPSSDVPPPDKDSA